MADVSVWFAETTHPAQGWRDEDLATGRRGDVGLEIADDPVSIVVMRGESDLAAQTVRLLLPRLRPGEQGSTGGEQAEVDLIVLAKYDADIERDDRFFADSQLYEVFYVLPNPTNRLVEAWCRQVQ
jgi:hypothetical protein